MKSKLLLRFYFRADKLERSINNLITHCAVASASKTCETCSARIIELINHKVKLSHLWDFLHKTLREFPTKQYNCLGYYAVLREDTSTLPEGVKNSLRKATVKFARAIKDSILLFSKEVALLEQYDALI